MPIVAKRYLMRVAPVTIIEVTAENIAEVIDTHFTDQGLTVSRSDDGTKSVAVPSDDTTRAVFEAGDYLVIDDDGHWVDTLDCPSAVDEHYQPLI